MVGIRRIQLGKSKVTESFIANLKTHFDKVQTVKVSVLKNSCRDREELKEITEEILEKLGKNYTARVIGFTINLKKWRREMR